MHAHPVHHARCAPSEQCRQRSAAAAGEDEEDRALSKLNFPQLEANAVLREALREVHVVGSGAAPGFVLLHPPLLPPPLALLHGEQGMLLLLLLPLQVLEVDQLRPAAGRWLQNNWPELGAALVAGRAEALESKRWASCLSARVF